MRSKEGLLVVGRYTAMRRMPSPDQRHGRYGAARKPSATYQKVSGVVLCFSVQAQHFGSRTAGASWCHLQKAWYMRSRIRRGMGQRDNQHKLSGTIEFDDAFFGGSTAGKKCGRGAGKAKVFVALSLDSKGNPRFLKMKTMKDICQRSVRTLAQAYFSQA